jgi:hypothetical protein
MKKVFMLLIASAALTMTACGGKKEEKKAEASAEAATPEATAEEMPMMDASSDASAE